MLHHVSSPRDGLERLDHPATPETLPSMQSMEDSVSAVSFSDEQWGKYPASRPSLRLSSWIASSYRADANRSLDP